MRQSHSINGRIATTALVLGCVIAGAAIATSRSAEAAGAARRAPRSTHIGVPLSDIVVLDLIDTTTATPKFVRVNTDGTRETAEFTVPAGRAFVLTSYEACGDWKARASSVRFWIEDPDTGDRTVVLSAAAYGDGALSSNSTEGGVHGTVLEGRVFGEGTQLAIDNVVTRNLAFSRTLQTWDVAGDFQVTVGGYLVNAD
jgi:hypothetical protein